jgi:Fe-S cluster assembly protein SufD
MTMQSYAANYSNFEETLAARGPNWLKETRGAALLRFSKLGLPSRKNEEWKYTSTASIGKTTFAPVLGTDSNGLSADDAVRLDPFGQAAHRLVFVNGHFAENLSQVGDLPKGVRLSSLAEVLDQDPELVESILTQPPENHPHAFGALNGAFIQDGAYLSVSRGTAVEHPIHLLFVSTNAGEATVSHPRNVIVLEENSQAIVFESYVGLTQDATYFTNAVSDIVIAPYAVLRHVKLQQESPGASHIASLRVHQGASSNYNNTTVSTSGALIRNDLTAVIDGEGVETTINGLYLARHRQHVDNHTIIDHTKPNCNSHQLYKGILDDRATAVFNGKIFVREDAQKTDAKQSNKNLMLSPNCAINTKPQLEIWADDVKCTHGATIGQIDDEALYYLRTRGINKTAALELLTFAFANELLDLVPVEAARAPLEEIVHGWLGMPTEATP